MGIGKAFQSGYNSMKPKKPERKPMAITRKKTTGAGVFVVAASASEDEHERHSGRIVQSGLSKGASMASGGAKGASLRSN
jgi:hypothetical protein